jgi:hypothetical protein
VPYFPSREEYEDISREMVSLELRCRRIIEERGVANDREAVAEFGEKLWHWARGNFDYPANWKSSLHPLYRYQVALRAKKEGEKEAGFGYLMDAADAMKLAVNPEMFEKLARRVEKFLSMCHAHAEEVADYGGVGDLVAETFNATGNGGQKV